MSTFLTQNQPSGQTLHVYLHDWVFKSHDVSRVKVFHTVQGPYMNLDFFFLTM